MHERITDEDLVALVDGQLGQERRIIVEAYLARNPEIAAAVMQDLHLRDEINLFMSAPWPSTTTNIAVSRQATRRLRRRSWAFRMRRGFAAAAFVGIGWFLHAAVGTFSIDPLAAASPAPAFVGDAAQAHRAMQIKFTTAVNPNDGILHLPARHEAGDVPVPRLAAGLRLVGTDLVPWGHGTAILALYAGNDGEMLTLFAAEDESAAISAPQAIEADGVATAFWQQGYFVYALSGSRPPDELLTFARAAANRS